MGKKGNIGIFDSGFGGLWILRYLRENLPDYNYIFVADQAHVPYGIRSLLEIRDFSEKITEFLIKNDCKIIVIACNTASAASLKYLREKFPDIFFVGMEPAVKPAVENTHTHKVAGTSDMNFDTRCNSWKNCPADSRRTKATEA